VRVDPVRTGRCVAVAGAETLARCAIGNDRRVLAACGGLKALATRRKRRGKRRPRTAGRGAQGGAGGTAASYEVLLDFRWPTGLDVGSRRRRAPNAWIAH